MNTNFSNARSNFLKSIVEICKSIYPCLQKGLQDEIATRRKQICKDLAKNCRFMYELADEVISSEQMPNVDNTDKAFTVRKILSL